MINKLKHGFKSFTEHNFYIVKSSLKHHILFSKIYFTSSNNVKILNYEFNYLTARKNGLLFCFFQRDEGGKGLNQFCVCFNPSAKQGEFKNF